MTPSPHDPLIPDVAGAAAFEQIQVLREPAIGLLGFLVIHDTRLGPAFGGIRLWDYPTPGDALADAMRLAEHMTLKCAIQEVPGGGGKVALMRRPGMDRGAVYRRLGDYIAALQGRYFTGPDVGTEAADLLAVGERTSFVGLPDVRGPRGMADATTIGVFAGIRSVAQRLGFESLAGLRVVVTGLGEVGGRLADRLAAAGARLTVADVRTDRVAVKVQQLGAVSVEPERAHAAECDVFAPCALGGVVNATTIPELACRSIAGCANNILASVECGAELHRRGILYAPDFVINSGGLVHGALSHLHGKAPPVERIEQIGDLLDRIFAASAAEDLPPAVIADRTARARVASVPHRMYIPSR